MCLTRVGRIISIEGPKARIRYLDGVGEHEIDVSTIEAKKGGYVEIFALSAIGMLTKREADLKSRLRKEMLRRAGRPIS